MTPLRMATRMPAFPAAWAVGLLLWATVLGAQGADPADSTHEISLQGALPGEKPIALYLDVRGGTVRRAFAAARTFNRMPYDVDASALGLEGGQLAGTVRVTIPSDGYTPKDANSVECRFELTAALAGGKVTGTYAGTYGAADVKGDLAGAYQARPRDGDSGRITLECENAVILPKGAKPDARRARIVFGLRDGKGFGGKLDPPGSITDVAFAARIETTDVQLADGRLTGTIAAFVRHQGGETFRFTYTLDGTVIGSAVAGGFKTVRNGQEMEGGRFVGNADAGPAPRPQDGLLTLVLHDALQEGGFLKLYLATRDGRFQAGFGATPNYNNATHEVDVSGLALDDKTLRGTVKVVVQPDPWVPPDHKPVDCAFQVKADLQDAEIAGTYEGTVGGRKVSGPLDGGVDPKPALGPPAGMTLKLENALAGGNPWQNRAFLTMALDGTGKITGGRVWNNHTSLGGTIDSGRVAIDNGRLAVDMRITVAAGGVAAGTYSFKVAGAVVGRICAGTFQTFRDGQGPVKTGRFWGSMLTSSETAKP